MILGEGGRVARRMAGYEARPQQVAMAEAAVGQAVLLKVRAFPSRDFRGTIRTIAPIASARDELIAGRAVLVSAEFDNSELLLKPEMTGQCKIYCGQRRILDVFTRRLVGYIRVEFWSWW